MSLHRRSGISEDAQQSEASLLHSTRRTATVSQPSKQPTATAKMSQLSRSHSIRTPTTFGQSRVMESGPHHAAPAARSVYGPSLPRASSAQSTSTPSTAIGPKMHATVVPSKSTKVQSAESLSGIPEQARRPANILRLQDRSVKSASEYPSRSDMYRVPKPRPGTDYDQDPDGIFGIAFPEPLKPLKKKIAIPAMGPRARAEELPSALIPELQALAASSAMIRRQVPPAMAPVSSPSTLYSESPGPWSSRNTTPMSMSSYSPGIVQPIKLSSTARQLTKSATPSMPRTTTSVPGVSIEDESRARSAKQRQPASHVFSNDKVFLTPKREAQQLRKQKPQSPAPTLPPRKSSVKHKSSGASANVLIDSTQDMRARQESFSDLKALESPLEWRAPDQVDYVGESLRPAPSIKTPLPKTPLNPSQELPRSGRGVYNRPSMIPNSGQSRPVVPEISINVPSMKDISKSGTINKSTRSESPGPKTGFAKLSSALFRRRKPPDQTANTVEKPSRRGPAAGTGHEGYRKHTFGSRKTSSESMASHAMSSDSERQSTRRKESNVSRRESKSSKDEQSRDQFVAQRRDPVVILGGGGYRNRPESDAPAVWPALEQTATQAANSSETRRLTQQAPSENESTLYRTLTPYDDHDMPPRERDEDESAAKQAQIKSSLRSFTPSQAEGKEQIRTSTPIKTDIFATASALASYTTSQSSLPQSETTAPFIGNEMHRVDVKYLKKPTKEGRKLRWNFFQRSQSSTKHTKVIEPDIRQPWMEVPVTITTIPNPRSMPYYAVMDSEPEIQSPDSLGEYMAQAVDSSSQDRANDFPQSSSDPSRNHGHSVLLPSLPVLQGESFVYRPASPQVPLQQQEPPSGSSSPSPPDSKPQRLAQVGRIPRVISRKNHHHVPPAESYSRPFSSGRIEEVPFLLSNTITKEAERPILGVQTDVLPSRPFDDFDSGKPSSAPTRGPVRSHDDQSEPDQEFLSFAPKHDSEMSISSSSDGVISIAAPHYALPVVYHHGDEEVWGEYDELIDRVWTPNSPNAMHVSVQERSGPGDLRALAKQQRAMSRRTREMAESTDVGGSMLVPAVQLGSPRESTESFEHVRLRRSKIADALHSSMSPTSPFALGDLLADYTDRHRGSTQHPRLQKNPISRNSLTDVPTTHSQALPDAVHTRVHTQESLDKGSAAQSELQYAALMTSKWLSGRLLVSPAHADTQPERHVLVIDGLNNSDWSFYCALTYSTALIHDLRESDPVSTRSKPAKQPSQAPANYRQAEVSSLAEQFPFPPSFFAAVVFRFPPAFSDGVLRKMLTECKRVMKPGGYLEFTLLDMDMVNMGSLTRRAVRDLKVRLTTDHPEVSLKPVGDKMQDLLGRRGFINLNRCVVGVPVAGKVAGSIDSSSSSRSSKDSYTKMLRDTSGTRQARPSTSSGKVRQDRGADFSLADLVSDHSPASDDKITKMVSKVGRWWYSRTYEDRVQPTESIWADKKVLRECKAKGTGFKMFIAYAQKPVENRRRTVSEPMLPTLVTVGVPGMKRTR